MTVYGEPPTSPDGDPDPTGGAHRDFRARSGPRCRLRHRVPLVAGLMNLLLLMDVWDIAKRRKD
jgi:hypothetical protein